MVQMAEDFNWADAWQSLVHLHAPFRPNEGAVQDLLRQLSELERLFLNTPELGSYYADCMRRVPPTPAVAADGSQSLPGHPPTPLTAASATRHAIAMQLQLMEDAFYGLRLDRYANAPDNRGWINLFRRWGNSPTFQQHARLLKTTFSPEFIYFYDHYVEGWPEDVHVPHPWDLPRRRAADRPAVFGRLMQVGVELCLRQSARGIFLDPGRREAGHRRRVDEPPPSRGRLRDATAAPEGPDQASAGGDGEVTDSSATTD
jgi:hypothetical protein